MVSFDIFKIMTFVLILLAPTTHAAPSLQVNLEAPTEQNESSFDTNTAADAQGLIISQPKTSVKKEIKTSYFYPYKQSMSPRMGIVIDPDLIKDGDLPLILGVRYMVPERKPPQWEVGFDLVTDEGAHISVGRRYIAYAQNPFRGYVIVGGLLAAQADEKLATFTDYENYFVKLSAGFEDVITMPMSVRIEFEFAVGIERQFAMLSLGYSWGW